MKRYKTLLVPLAGVLFLWGCINDTAASEENIGESSEVQQYTDGQDMFTERDMEQTYEEEESVEISLLGQEASCDLDTVEIDGSNVTITEEGTYILSGTLDDGMIIVDSENSKIQLVLNGVEINSMESAAIYIKEADKVFLTTADGSENILSNGGTYTEIDENSIDAVIFSKADLTLNGSGSLKITAEEGHGIVSKDDLVLTGGNYEITAASHGLSGKDSIRIADGNYSIVSGKDGIHAENADDETLGFVYLADGQFSIDADGDGISAENWIQVEGGSYEIISGQGSENASEKNQDFGAWDFQQQEEEENTVSTKGIKAGLGLTINGGSYKINSEDDSLHSNENVNICGGEFELASGDDGIHGDGAVVIWDGTVQISESYEGIEGLTLDINGGDITLTASDDGLNAAGGNDSSGFGGRGGDQFAAQEGVYIHISGGMLRINALGDGIDSNGDFTVSGGETYVSGPTDNNNGALDYNGEASISGGIFMAAGSSGMVENFGTSSTQGVMMVTVGQQEAASRISLSDSSGEEVLSWEPEKTYSFVIVSCPEIIQGEEYTLTVGEETLQITMDSLVYGESAGMGEMKDRGGMGRQNQKPGMENNRQDAPSMKSGYTIENN